MSSDCSYSDYTLIDYASTHLHSFIGSDFLMISEHIYHLDSIEELTTYNERKLDDLGFFERFHLISLYLNICHYMIDIASGSSSWNKDFIDRIRHKFNSGDFSKILSVHKFVETALADNIERENPILDLTGDAIYADCVESLYKYLQHKVDSSSECSDHNFDFWEAPWNGTFTIGNSKTLDSTLPRKHVEYPGLALVFLSYMAVIKSAPATDILWLVDKNLLHRLLAETNEIDIKSRVDRPDYKEEILSVYYDAILFAALFSNLDKSIHSYLYTQDMLNRYLTLSRHNDFFLEAFKVLPENRSSREELINQYRTELLQITKDFITTISSAHNSLAINTQ